MRLYIVIENISVNSGVFVTFANICENHLGFQNDSERSENTC